VRVSFFFLFFSFFFVVSFSVLNLSNFITCFFSGSPFGFVGVA
jgi:hypothetical protein